MGLNHYLMGIICIIGLTIMPWAWVSLLLSYDYAEYLMYTYNREGLKKYQNKYGVERLGRIRGVIYLMIPYIEKYYTKDRRKKRFIFFLWESRVLTLLLLLWIIFSFVIITFWHGDASSRYSLLEELYRLLVLYPSLFGLITLIPFGGIEQILRNGDKGRGDYTRHWKA